MDRSLVQPFETLVVKLSNYIIYVLYNLASPFPKGTCVAKGVFKTQDYQ
jgi:hypothetical protein